LEIQESHASILVDERTERRCPRCRRAGVLARTHPKDFL